MSFFVQTGIVIALAGLAHVWKRRRGGFWFSGLAVWFLVVNVICVMSMAGAPRYTGIYSQARRLEALYTDATFYAAVIAATAALVIIAAIPRRT
jgi:hypothetical protein